ncbi:hypothetical protein ACFWY9_14680 [Amycolatopsis sp. NPDC059027]|uniref:hypothetical protein n=1 Tax=unclassified Amycolatopsis TaxID=2618356 RepID=UPI00366DBA6E
MAMVDWGTVPAWVSAGSFLLGYIVFVRDRRERQRRQVEKVGLWADDFGLDPLGGNTTPMFLVKNDSGLPIQIVELRYVIAATVERWNLESMVPVARSWNYRSSIWVFKNVGIIEPGLGEAVKLAGTPVLRNDLLLELLAIVPRSNDWGGYSHTFDINRWRVDVVRVVFEDNSGRRWYFNTTSGKGVRPYRRRNFYVDLLSDPNRGADHWHTPRSRLVARLVYAARRKVPKDYGGELRQMRRVDEQKNDPEESA